MAADVRTREHAIAEVRFAMEFGSLNERFWQRLDTWMSFAQILAGALALAGAFTAAAWLAGGAGIALAFISSVQLTLQPMRRSIDFRDARRRFAELNRRAPAMQLADIDDELERLKADAPHSYVQPLMMPAFNIVQAQNGEPTRPLNWIEKLALKIA